MKNSKLNPMCVLACSLACLSILDQKNAQASFCKFHLRQENPYTRQIKAKTRIKSTRLTENRVLDRSEL